MPKQRATLNGSKEQLETILKLRHLVMEALKEHQRTLDTLPGIRTWFERMQLHSYGCHTQLPWCFNGHLWNGSRVPELCCWLRAERKRSAYVRDAIRYHLYKDVDTCRTYGTWIYRRMSRGEICTHLKPRGTLTSIGWRPPLWRIRWRRNILRQIILHHHGWIMKWEENNFRMNKNQELNQLHFCLPASSILTILGTLT